MINNLKTVAIIVLIAVAIILNWRLESKQKEIENLAIGNGILADKLKCQIAVEKDRIVYKTRVKDKKQSSNGQSPEISSKVITKTEYVSPEGKAIISVDLNGNVDLKIKNKGLCFCPCISLQAGFDGKLNAGLGARLGYWGRYGLGGGINISRDRDNIVREITSPFLLLDRRISDFVPLVRNTTIGIVYDGNVGISLSIYF